MENDDFCQHTDVLSDSDGATHQNAARLQVVHQVYRMLEKDKRHYHIDTEGLMRRQQASLDNLKSDNYALQEMVDTYVIKDYRQQMAHLLEEAKKYSILVEAETKTLHELEAAVSDTTARELDAKKKMGGYKAGWTKHRTTQIHIQQAENRLQKKFKRMTRKLTKTHYAKRRKAGDYYRKWVEIKAFANTQDVLKIDNISGVFSGVVEAQKKNEHLYKELTELLKEMDGLDMVKQDHIFEARASEIADSKSSMTIRRYETDQTVDHLIESLRHLEVDDEAFVPIVIDMKKKILSLFKEAGCYIKDDAIGLDDDSGNEKNTPNNQYPELTIGKFVGKLEDFVDRISGTFS